MKEPFDDHKIEDKAPCRKSWILKYRADRKNYPKLSYLKKYLNEATQVVHGKEWRSNPTTQLLPCLQAWDCFTLHNHCLAHSIEFVPWNLSKDYSSNEQCP